MKYTLSFGGGLNSTALLVYIVKNKLPLDIVVFADTGNEFNYTYDNVKFYKKWAEDRGIRFEIVKSKYGKDLYTYCWDKKIVPSRMKRDCTSKFKISPIRKFLRTEFGKKEIFTTYIGIALEESHRMRDSNVKYEVLNYPLVDAKIDREGCMKLLEQEGLPIPNKSGCWFCPFTKKQNWLDMIKNEPDLYNKAIALEKNVERYPHSVSLLSSKPLEIIKNSVKTQTQLVDFEHTCDVASTCFL